jgi:protein-disulfide isomerase
MRLISFICALLFLCLSLIDISRGKAQAVEYGSFSPGVSHVDMIEAMRSVLREQPELILEALEQNPVALAELVQRASIVREVEAEKERRLREFTQPKTPVIDVTRPIRGNPEGLVTIVEYGDFECSFCRSASSTIGEVLRQHEGKLRFVYKHNPLSFHPMAELSARYFEAVAMQDLEQAWLFHDQVYEQQDQLAQGEQALQAIVASLQIDRRRLENDLYSETVEHRLILDRDETNRFGFDGTPAFLINGVSLVGSQPKEDFEEIIRMFSPDVQRGEPIVDQAVR